MQSLGMALVVLAIPLLMAAMATTYSALGYLLWSVTVLDGFLGVVLYTAPARFV